MGVLDDFPASQGYLLKYHLTGLPRELFALYDAGGRPGADEAGRTAFGLWAQLRLSLGDEGGHAYPEEVLRLVREAAGGDIPWTFEDTRVLWEIADALSGCGHTAHAELYRIPLAAIATLGYSERRRILDDAPPWHPAHRNPGRAALRKELERVLTEPPEHGAAGVVRSLVWDGDPVARAMAGRYADRLTQPAVLPLLKHWCRAKAGRPSEAWLAKVRTLLTDDGVAVLREILSRVATHRESREPGGRVFLARRTALPLRGMLWTCEVIDAPWVSTLLGDIAVNCGIGRNGTGGAAVCRNERLANAALNVLAKRGGLDTVGVLARVRARLRRPALLAKASDALDAVAVQEGLSHEQLVDRTVPAFGLGPDGVREERAGDCVVRLDVDGPVLRFVNASGRVVKSAPRSIREDPVLADLKATLKDLKRTQAAERLRLEQMLIVQRALSWQEAERYFFDHPVTGPYTRALVWRLPDGFAGLPVRDGGGWALADASGGSVRPEADTPVRLWHPVQEGAEGVRGWRDHLLERRIRQPFKQVFREVYLLTPAEERTRTHSDRFTGHLVRYGQAKALLEQRGWTGLSIGHWDYECDGDVGAAVKTLAGWQASWGMQVASDPRQDDWGTASCAATDAIRFRRAGLPGDAPLTEVPPLVFSELLRDADLAVGVGSLGLDQQAAGHDGHRQPYGFGELTETARTRRDALARLLPRLTIADRAELTDRFLRVRGDLRTYRIHLGSGNILMEPNDAYLCIVPRGGGDQVFLPFEEDGGMLSVILSKAFLLADDTAITDASITRQLVAT
ncbi:DUF4132 domain-containing protein [Planomonospora sp. ID82291]|uniref:DUF4132 domain-containing protein n=1 Tax=Planomonospora sp. ID82291 TaxID=2738136 RepID=UPI0018C36940|nr:DUF4132 domain-containing protein [Planomonospora sp. ID82291]MBG0815696.1 DUF4132 domain-containing protein [Planomonospora sp. ID82291]